MISGFDCIPVRNDGHMQVPRFSAMLRGPTILPRSKGALSSGARAIRDSEGSADSRL